MCKFDRDLVICLLSEAVFVTAQKCPYHVTFDLDLKHILDAGLPGDHCVQVWLRSVHLPARRSDVHVHYVHYVHRDEQITILRSR